MKPTGNRILLLHPGEMGHAIGRALMAAGQTVSWVSENRSEASRKRADSAGLTSVRNLRDGLADADLVLSVCPPDAAEAQATTVAEAGYKGPYLDANAVAPETVRRMGELLSKAGVQLIDGGIVGSPPKSSGTTRFFVSGTNAEEVTHLFSGSVVDAIPAGDAIGAASAVKMAYAAWTKGSSALLIAIRALARSEQVEALLLDEWARSQPALVKRELGGSIAKAWRFVGEMHEVSKTFTDNDLPPGFHLAAAELYQALSPCKDNWDVTLEDALPLLVRPKS